MNKLEGFPRCIYWFCYGTTLRSVITVKLRCNCWNRSIHRCFSINCSVIYYLLFNFLQRHLSGQLLVFINDLILSSQHVQYLFLSDIFGFIYSRYAFDIFQLLSWSIASYQFVLAVNFWSENKLFQFNSIFDMEHTSNFC